MKYLIVFFAFLLGCKCVTGSNSTLSIYRDVGAIEIPDDNCINCLDFSTDGKCVAGGLASGEVVLWNSTSLAELCRFGHLLSAQRFGALGPAGVQALTISPNGDCIAFAGYYGDSASRLELWEREKGITRSWKIPEGTFVSTLACARDGKHFAAALAIHDGNGHDRQHSILICETTGERTDSIALPISSASVATRICFIRGDTALLVGSDVGGVSLWDLATKAITKQFHVRAGVCDLIAINRDTEIVVSDKEGVVTQFHLTGDLRSIWSESLPAPSRLIAVPSGYVGFGGNESIVLKDWSRYENPRDVQSFEFLNSQGQCSARCIGIAADQHLVGWDYGAVDATKMRIRVRDFGYLGSTKGLGTFFNKP